jgi:predicted ATPase
LKSEQPGAGFWNTKGQPQYGRGQAFTVRHLLLFFFGPIGSGKHVLLNVFIVCIFQFHSLLNEKFSSLGKIHQILHKCFELNSLPAIQQTSVIGNHLPCELDFELLF